MESDFRSVLLGSPAIISIIGINAGPNPAAGPSIYPSTYAQAAVGPAIRYNKITGADDLHMQGTDGLDVTLMQVDVRAATYASALAVRDALRARLSPFRGVVGNTDFRLIRLRDDRGVQYDDTGATKYFTASLDFDVISRAAA